MIALISEGWSRRQEQTAVAECNAEEKRQIAVTPNKHIGTLPDCVVLFAFESAYLGARCHLLLPPAVSYFGGLRKL